MIRSVCGGLLMACTLFGTAGGMQAGQHLPERLDGVPSSLPERLDRVPPLSADGDGAIPYFIAEGSPASGHQASDTQLAIWALQEWERSAAGSLRFRRADREETSRLRIYWLPPSTDGEMGRMAPSVQDGRDVASLLIRPDEEQFRPSVRRRVRADPLMRDVVVYFVCLHEIGHALGLAHSTNLIDVMFSGSNGATLPVYDRYRKHLENRESIPRMSWLSKEDVGRLHALWPAVPK